MVPCSACWNVGRSEAEQCVKGAVHISMGSTTAYVLVERLLVDHKSVRSTAQAVNNCAIMNQVLHR